MRRPFLVAALVAATTGAASGKGIKDLDAIDHGFISAAFQACADAMYKSVDAHDAKDDLDAKYGAHMVSMPKDENYNKGFNSDIRAVSRMHMVGNRDFNLGHNMAMKRAVQGDYMLMHVCREAADTPGGWMKLYGK